MANQVEEVKQKTDIISIIGSFIELKKAGRNYKALCPFHAEKTPSFMVSPELQFYKCFGCGESGDVITFLEKYEGMEFYEALKYLADKAGVKLEPIGTGQTGEKEKLFTLNNLTSRFYNYVLLNHKLGKEALFYLREKRGLKLETIKKFNLGFSPMLQGPLVNFLVKKKKYHPKELFHAGLVYSRGNLLIDRFRGRVIFPLADHRGNTIGFAGRILPQDENKDLAKYINSPETEIYKKSRVLYALNLTKENIKKERSVVVVEGELDLISSYQAGIKNIVAIKGSALTKEQVNLLSRFVDKLILAYDSDIAGDAACRRGIGVAQESGLEIKVAEIKDYKDPDDMARQNPQGLKRAVGKPIPVWDFFVNSTFAKFDSKTGEGKARISKEIVPILSSIPDKIVQAHYIELVAEKLNIPESAVTAQVAKEKPKEKESETEEKVETAEEKTRRTLLEERLLAIIFQSDPEELLNDEVKKLILTFAYQKIINAYEEYRKEKKSFDPSDFAKTLPKEVFVKFSEVVLKDIEQVVTDEEKRIREFDLTLRELEILGTKETLEKLKNAISKYEKENNKDKLKKAQDEFLAISKRLIELEETRGKGIIL